MAAQQEEVESKLPHVWRVLESSSQIVPALLVQRGKALGDDTVRQTRIAYLVHLSCLSASLLRELHSISRLGAVHT